MLNSTPSPYPNADQATHDIEAAEAAASTAVENKSLGSRIWRHQLESLRPSTLVEVELAILTLASALLCFPGHNPV